MNWSDGYNIHAVIAVAIGLVLFVTGGIQRPAAQNHSRAPLNRAGFAAHLAKRRAGDARRHESRSLWRFAGAGMLALGIVYLAINLREVAG